MSPEALHREEEVRLTHHRDVARRGRLDQRTLGAPCRARMVAEVVQHAAEQEVIAGTEAPITERFDDRPFRSQQIDAFLEPAEREERACLAEEQVDATGFAHGSRQGLRVRARLVERHQRIAVAAPPRGGLREAHEVVHGLRGVVRP